MDHHANEIYQAVNALKADLNNTGCSQHLKYLKIDFDGNYLTSRVQQSRNSASKLVCSVDEFNHCVDELKSNK
jgi:hypothetical protein